jgi:hypothetical protein
MVNKSITQSTSMSMTIKPTIKEYKIKILVRFVKKAAKYKARNWNYEEQEYLRDYLVQDIWIKLLDNPDWYAAGILNDKGEVTEELQIKIRDELSNIYKRWNHHREQHTPQSSFNEEITEPIDSSINIGRCKSVGTNNRKNGAKKLSWERSKRFPNYEETHSYIVNETVPKLSKKQREVVDLIIQDPYSKNRPKGEKSQRDWVTTELGVSKDMYIQTKKDVEYYYQGEYKYPHTIPFIISASGIPPQYTDCTFTSANIFSAQQSCSSSLMGQTPTCETDIKNNLSDSESIPTTNGEQTLQIGGTKSDKNKNKEVEYAAITNSGILIYFTSLLDVNDFLQWVELPNQEKVFTVRHKRKNQTYIHMHHGTKHYHKPEGTEALFIDSEAGCCGLGEVQHLCYEDKRFSWFCWNCGDKDNTAKCYMYYKNTLSGFLLSLFEQQNDNVKTLIRHAKEWNCGYDGR